MFRYRMWKPQWWQCGFWICWRSSCLRICSTQFWQVCVGFFPHPYMCTCSCEPCGVLPQWSALHLNDAWIVHGSGPPTVFHPAPISSLFSQHWLTALLPLSTVFYSSYWPSQNCAHRQIDCLTGRRTGRHGKDAGAHSDIYIYNHT